MSVSQISTNEIARLAYFLWQQRGCPFGSPEVDWRKAEEQFLRQAAAGVQNQPTPFSFGWKILQDQRKRYANQLAEPPKGRAESGPGQTDAQRESRLGYTGSGT
jgi:hypothetical protein